MSNIISALNALDVASLSYQEWVQVGIVNFRSLTVTRVGKAKSLAFPHCEPWHTRIFRVEVI